MSGGNPYNADPTGYQVQYENGGVANGVAGWKDIVLESAYVRGLGLLRSAVVTEIDNQRRFPLVLDSFQLLIYSTMRTFPAIACVLSAADNGDLFGWGSIEVLSVIILSTLLIEVFTIFLTDCAVRQFDLEPIVEVTATFAWKRHFQLASHFVFSLCTFIMLLSGRVYFNPMLFLLVLTLLLKSISDFLVLQHFAWAMKYKTFHVRFAVSNITLECIMVLILVFGLINILPNKDHGLHI